MEELELGFAPGSNHFLALLPGNLCNVIQAREYAFDGKTYRGRRATTSYILHSLSNISAYCLFSLFLWLYLPTETKQLVVLL